MQSFRAKSDKVCFQPAAFKNFTLIKLSRTEINKVATFSLKKLKKKFRGNARKQNFACMIILFLLAQQILPLAILANQRK